MMEGMGRPRETSWRLNACDLREVEIANNIRKDSELCFLQNQESVNSAMVLWEDYKAVLRDWAQNALSQKKNREVAEIESLEHQIVDLMNSPGACTDPNALHSLELLPHMYQDLAMGEALRQLLATQHHIFNAGDKADTLLAWLSKSKKK